MNKFRIRSVFSIANAEYIKWLTNPRIIIVGVLFIFMRTLAVEPLLERAEKFGGNLNILEPFAAIGNSGMLVMLMPCVFLILISDYPIISGNTIFVLHRTGKLNWFIGQLVFIIYAIFTYITTILTVSVLTSGGTFGTRWSEVVRKYNYVYPSESANFASELLPSNLYNQISLIKTIIYTVILMIAYLFILALVLYIFKILHIQSAGIFAVFAIVGMGVASCSLKTKIMWMFPMANTIVWLHYEEILSEPVYPIWSSFLYFLIVIAVLLSISLIALKKMQFINIEQIR